MTEGQGGDSKLDNGRKAGGRIVTSSESKALSPRSKVADNKAIRFFGVAQCGG